MFLWPSKNQFPAYNLHIKPSKQNKLITYTFSDFMYILIQLNLFNFYFIKLSNYFCRIPVCHTIITSRLTVAISNSVLYHNPPIWVTQCVTVCSTRNRYFNNCVFTMHETISQIHLCDAKPSRFTTLICSRLNRVSNHSVTNSKSHVYFTLPPKTILSQIIRSKRIPT